MLVKNQIFNVEPRKTEFIPIDKAIQELDFIDQKWTKFWENGSFCEGRPEKKGRKSRELFKKGSDL